MPRGVRVDEARTLDPAVGANHSYLARELPVPQLWAVSVRLEATGQLRFPSETRDWKLEAVSTAAVLQTQGLQSLSWGPACLLDAHDTLLPCQDCPIQPHRTALQSTLFGSK